MKFPHQKKKIKEISERTVSANWKNKTINILAEFKNHIQNLKEVDTTQTIYALRIKNIIQQERKKSDRTISLKKIQTIYNSKYSPKNKFSNNKPNNEKTFVSTFQADNSEKPEIK